MRAVRKKYDAARFDVVWRRSCSLPSFRYPYPFPVHNQNWRPYYGKDNVPLVDVALPGGSVTLRLRGGPDMGRQLAAFREIVAGAKCGELSLYKKNGHSMVKLVAHFPRREAKPADKTMLVRTDPSALWVAEVQGTHTRVWNQDHVRALVERHRVWLQRVSEDTKREKRVPQQMRRHIDHARDDRCRKQNDRLTTFCHEMTAQLAHFAARQGACYVIYDDRAKGWLPNFPWHDLKTKLAYKLNDRGIALFPGEKESLPESSTLTDDGGKPLWENVERLIGQQKMAMRLLRLRNSLAPSRSHPAVSVPPKRARSSARR
jgi:hypothetical protein